MDTSSDAGTTRQSRSDIDAAPSLREAFDGLLQVGCAMGGTALRPSSPEHRALVVRQFGVVTPENCMKPGPIHPEPERFDYADADALSSFAERHSLSVVGHCLAWHQQSPAFLYEDEPDRALALARLRAHVDGVAGHYRNRVVGWDVVNEAVADDGRGLKDTPARRAIGDDYVERIFELAEAADPNAALYYNDYDIELPAKRDATLALLQRLQKSGVRVDGVGIQGHWQLDQVPFDDVRRAIEAYATLGLEVMITELDLDVVPRPGCGADVALHHEYQPADDLLADGCPDDVLERQAEQYAKLFEIFTDPRSKVSRVTFWGVEDGHSWLNYWPGKRTNHPLLFDRHCQPKPAHAAVVAVGRARASGSRR